MDVKKIDKEDAACYWVFDPKNFVTTSPACLNLNLKSFFSSNTSHPYHLSVNSKSLCKSFPEDIHALGFAQAERLTARRKEKGKDFIETYEGFLTAGVEEIENIGYSEHMFKVAHDPKKDNYAHCNVILKFPQNLNKPRKSVRDLMADDLNTAFGNVLNKPK